MADTISTPAMRDLARRQWKANWPLVLAASVGFSFFSVMLAAGSVFAVPLAQDFGWNKTQLSLGVSISTFTTAILGPFFGMLVDRFGARRFVLPGTILTMGVISAYGLMQGPVWQWYALWLLFGLVAVTIKSTAWTAAVVGVFTGSRGLALGLTLAGAAVAGMIVPPLSVALITAVGWRASFAWIGIGWGAVAFVLCYFFFFDVHNKAGRASAAAGAAIELPGLTKRQGLLDTALWRLAFSNFVVMALNIGLTFHLFMILTEGGVSKTNAAWLISLASLVGIGGKLLTGWLLDRYRPNWVGGITLGAMALAFVLLMDGIRTPGLIIVAMLVNGYTFGTKTQITGNLTASYAGMKNFGFLYGIMSALMSLASGVGPLLAAYSADHLGGYDPFLLAGTVGCALSGLMMISLPAYPKFDNVAETEAEEEAKAFA